MPPNAEVGIGAICALVGVRQRYGRGHATGIGVLHDDAGRLVEHAHAFHRGVGVGDVVERQLLALEHARRRHAGPGGAELAIERGTLVRIFSVAQVLEFLVHQRKSFREGFPSLGFTSQQVRGHHGVVLRRVCERLGGERGARVDAGGAGIGIEIAQHARVIGRIDDHGHRFVVLRRGTHHRGAADVDVLDGVGVGAVRFGHGRRERIEVHRQQIDARDVVLFHDRIVDAAPPQQAAVHARVQRLDAPVHDLGKAGVRRNLSNRDARLGEQPGCTASAQQFDFACSQGAREINQSRLVGDRQQGPANRDEHREADSGRKAELSELLAQCSAVDAENGCGTALIARRSNRARP